MHRITYCAQFWIVLFYYFLSKKMKNHRASVDASGTSRSLLNTVDSCAPSTRRASSFEQRESFVTTATSKLNMSAGQTYEVVERGTLHTLDYRIFIKGPNGYVSPWHDVPLYYDEGKKIFNMIVEIPRWTNAKMEISTSGPLSPIKQDKKNGQPRFIPNIFPHHGYIWNYGALPQTWEDPNHKDNYTNAKGDNDPVDVIEIGSKIQKRGSVIPVKIVGVIALLDDGETDWKLIAISTGDPLASQINNINDVEKHFPGLLSATYEWLRIYKIPAGKPPNSFAFNGEFKGQSLAYEIIDKTNRAWKELIASQNPLLNTECHVPSAHHQADDNQWKSIVESFPPQFAPQLEPEEVCKWHFISQI